MLRQVLRNYRAWRVFQEDKVLRYNKYHSVKTYLTASPKQLVKVFGPPNLPEYNDSTGGFTYEDENFDPFTVIEHHLTSETVKEKHLQGKFIRPSLRYKEWPLPAYEDFWNSDEQKKFRVYANHYADLTGFCRWFYDKLKADVDIAASVIEEYGPIEFGDKYDKDYELRKDYAVFTYKPESWGLD